MKLVPEKTPKMKEYYGVIYVDDDNQNVHDYYYLEYIVDDYKMARYIEEFPGEPGVWAEVNDKGEIEEVYEKLEYGNGSRPKIDHLCVHTNGDKTEYITEEKLLERWIKPKIEEIVEELRPKEREYLVRYLTENK